MYIKKNLSNTLDFSHIILFNSQDSSLKYILYKYMLCKSRNWVLARLSDFLKVTKTQVRLTPNAIHYCILHLLCETKASSAFLVLTPTHCTNTEAHMVVAIISLYTFKWFSFSYGECYILNIKKLCGFSFSVLVPGINNVPRVIFSDYQFQEMIAYGWLSPELSDLHQ